MTNPTDAAIAQAFRERLESMYSPLTVREVMKAIETRARELDAEKGGPTFAQAMREAGRSVMSTPLAQAAEAVERVARAIFGNKWMSPRPDWETLYESTRDEYRAQARAAIAAMRAGEAGQ